MFTSEGVSFSVLSVCVFVCLFVCKRDNSWIKGLEISSHNFQGIILYWNGQTNSKIARGARVASLRLWCSRWAVLWNNQYYRTKTSLRATGCGRSLCPSRRPLVMLRCQRFVHETWRQYSLVLIDCRLWGSGGEGRGVKGSNYARKAPDKARKSPVCLLAARLMSVTM